MRLLHTLFESSLSRCRAIASERQVFHFCRWASDVTYRVYRRVERLDEWKIVNGNMGTEWDLKVSSKPPSDRTFWQHEIPQVRRGVLTGKCEGRAERLE